MTKANLGDNGEVFSAQENPKQVKRTFLLSFCNSAVGSKYLTPITQRNVCVRLRCNNRKLFI
jgi:hypothetical protein